MNFLSYCEEQGIERGSREYFLLKYLWHDLLREVHGYFQLGESRKAIEKRVADMRATASVDDRAAQRELAVKERGRV